MFPTIGKLAKRVAKGCEYGFGLRPKATNSISLVRTQAKIFLVRSEIFVTLWGGVQFLNSLPVHIGGCSVKLPPVHVGYFCF